MVAWKFKWLYSDISNSLFITLGLRRYRVCRYAVSRTAEKLTNASEMTLPTECRNFYADDMLASLPTADSETKLVEERDALVRNRGI